MLKSLELNGFKSFADRTRFEIPAGITVIVGPNGSGKSNVVDAMKWVLGEQSIKSLRGKESTDVIFNGASGRRAMNAAEVTLTFDNSDKRLAVEAPEVSITRRVYRSGEGEYLINKQVCRLKDIRELILGTGQGYSIIEQGRVDSLLQSSPQERRILFEEAAGISKFKKKKQEAQKRLEKFDLNLLRLSDFVGEVQRRLQQVKSQAQRAVKYRDYTHRLQELRFQAATMDYTQMTQRWEVVCQQLSILEEEHSASARRMDEADAQIQHYESETSCFDQRIREITDKIASNRHAIGVSESVVEFQSKRSRELEQTLEELRQRIVTMRQRMKEILLLQQTTQDDLRHAQWQHEQVVQTLTSAREMLKATVETLEKSKSEKELCREQRFEWMRKLAAAENEWELLVRQEENLVLQWEQNEARLVSMNEEIDQLHQHRENLEKKQAELEALKRRCEEDRQVALQELEVCERLWNDARTHLTELHRRHSSMGGRISTLEELQERHEGLSPGVRYLLTEARRQTEGPFRDICGLVADLIQVHVDAAGLIEVALGERAQYLVVASHSTLLESLRQNAQGFPGRVGFVWMDDFLPTPENLAGKMSRLSHVLVTNGLENLPGVVGRADQFVQCEEMYIPLFRFLLGETWIVENLAVAWDLRQEVLAGTHSLPIFPAVDFGEQSLSESARRKREKQMLAVPPRLHFVTLSGERLDTDGILCIGPQHISSGLISRRSELRTLGSQLTLLLDEIRQADEEVQKTHQKTLQQQSVVQQLEQESLQTDQLLREHEKNMTAAKERFVQMQQRQTELLQHRAEHQIELEEIRRRLELAVQSKSAASEESAQMDVRMASLDQQLQLMEQERREKTRSVTENQVELAKSEERLEGLKTRLRQNEEGVLEREKSIEEQRLELRQKQQLLEESARLTLGNETKLALLYSQKETLSLELNAVRTDREATYKERSEQTSLVNRLRKKLRGMDEKINAHQVEKGKLEQERQAVVERFSEDFNVTIETFLEQIEHLTAEEKAFDGEVQKEITHLRTQIQNLGNINSEALAEMDELEQRYEELSSHYQDLKEGKEKLLKLIERINTDSRKLFIQTFERIADYFYQIFRDLFGGGRAELQLDNENDVLESGIEIIAQPPGKELRSLSLMSGGEKTMTCVALLFALFKNHPSQFCILDEVDAALDEANIGRLTGILNQFHDQTQFLMISHSKKTMSVANTIYGVTMQDSGVSKQASVKFEEVSDDGELEQLGIRIFPSEESHAAAG